MEIAEKLGAFYIGKLYDLQQNSLRDAPVVYDARDLTTHAVVVGMTGSGKTGLAIDVLEEAALDRVPAIIIDPKGDMTNLMLTFPDLRPADFLPWVNKDDAARKGMTPEEYAKAIADRWRKGLAEWGEGAERVKALKESTDWRIYTPGSTAGIPVNVLQSLKAPESGAEDEELLREHILGTVSAILGLLGIDADPVRSREHVLLSNIFEYYWKQGKDLDLSELILAVQKPPMERLGVFDVDSFFPEKDRFGLAMTMNSLLASPSFQSWLEGEPMDVGNFLHAEDGRPRHSIFYIAHLNDAERMFFVTMLLEQVISWMRAQSGTTSLRAIVYMDEVFGFFPPISTPPSKRPMLTLLKQARAFGVGIMLATQNPVDLDYKGLTNAGTWFIGKLQTERDKSRLMEGLKSVSGGPGATREIEQAISSLGSRVFLLHNVHDSSGPHVFMTRWAMSYLRGPMTREQIKKLMAGYKTRSAGEARPSTGALKRPKATRAPMGMNSTPPAIEPSVQQAFLPVRRAVEDAIRELSKEAGRDVSPKERHLLYRPYLYASAAVHFYDSRRNVDKGEEIALLAESPGGRGKPDWDESEECKLTPDELEDAPEGEALFEDLPKGLERSKAYKTLARSFSDYLYRTRRVNLFYNPALKMYSKPDESERDFRIRCQETAREKRDEEIDALSEKFDKKRRRVEKKVEKQQMKMEESEDRYNALKRETYLTAGESVLGFLVGRRSTRMVSTLSRRHRIASQAKANAEEAKQEIESLKEEIKRLNEEAKEAARGIGDKWAEAVSEVKKVEIRPRKSDIDVQFFALAWVPFWAFVLDSGEVKTYKAYLADFSKGFGRI